MAGYSTKPVYSDDELISIKMGQFFEAKKDIWVSINDAGTDGFNNRPTAEITKEEEEVFEALLKSAKETAVREVLNKTNGIILDGKFEDKTPEEINKMRTSEVPFKG